MRKFLEKVIKIKNIFFWKIAEINENLQEISRNFWIILPNYTLLDSRKISYKSQNYNMLLVSKRI